MNISEAAHLPGLSQFFHEIIHIGQGSGGDIGHTVGGDNQRHVFPGRAFTFLRVADGRGGGPGILRRGAAALDTGIGIGFIIFGNAEKIGVSFGSSG